MPVYKKEIILKAYAGNGYKLKSELLTINGTDYSKQLSRWDKSKVGYLRHRFS